ncbi:Hypothetical predicted protein, partial [Pelobates cultripes]
MTNTSDGQSDHDSTYSKYSDTAITERSLHKMLQELRTTIRTDFHRIDSDLRKRDLYL